ncbi:hypothetical protein ACFZDF_27700 [Streptomyces sp. NPDC007910]|uniref:hypothetical protein n=1 Tax=unclassified Streptomyces TaxID=2593676 RepID=UPI000EF7B6D2|nr:hypothetical protein [Streptomyces sp. S1]
MATPWAAAGAAEQEGGERFAQQVSAEREPDPFRRGMLRIARATGTAEKAWPAEVLEELGGRAGQPS